MSYKFIGMNGLCFDIPNHSKEHGASLQLWRCHGESNQRFVLRQGETLSAEHLRGYQCASQESTSRLRSRSACG